MAWKAEVLREASWLAAERKGECLVFIQGEFKKAGSAMNRPFFISLPAKILYIDRQLGASLGAQSSRVARKDGRSRRAIQISPCHLMTPARWLAQVMKARWGSVEDVLGVVEGGEDFVAEPFGDVAVFGVPEAVEGFVGAGFADDFHFLAEAAEVFQSNGAFLFRVHSVGRAVGAAGVDQEGEVVGDEPGLAVDQDGA
jgi:hypothetical protein